MQRDNRPGFSASCCTDHAARICGTVLRVRPHAGWQSVCPMSEDVCRVDVHQGTPRKDWKQ